MGLDSKFTILISFIAFDFLNGIGCNRSQVFLPVQQAFDFVLDDLKSLEISEYRDDDNQKKIDR